MTAKISAQPSTQQASRILVFECRDPRTSFESNTAAWQTLNQSIAWGIDALNTSKGWNANLTRRSALFLGSLWLNSMLRFYSHEVAHEYVYRRHGIAMKNSLDFNHWKSSYLPGIYYPAWEQRTVDPSRLSAEDLISATVAGLNQDELNAKAMWSTSFRRNEFSFYDAQAYLLTKVRDVEYIRRSGSEEAPFAPGQQIHQLHHDVYAETPHLFDDVNLYRLALFNNGITISNRQLLQRALLADALSWHTWETLYAMAAYWIQGRASSTVFSWSIHPHLTVSPPLFSHYMTPEGSFINSTYRIKYHQQRLQLELGALIGFQRLHSMQRYRLGFHLLEIRVTPLWHVQPRLYVNGRSGFHFDGFSIGVDQTLSVFQTMALLVDVEYNHNDLFENLLKFKDNGWQAVFGVQMSL